MSVFTEAVAHHLRGVHFFSSGAMKGCPDCGLDDRICTTCQGEGVVEGFNANEFVRCGSCGGDPVSEPSQGTIDMANEPHLSWSRCDGCGSHLGGDRHPAHGIIADTTEEAQKPDRTITHFDVCTDCVMFHANGDEPEDWKG